MNQRVAIYCRLSEEDHNKRSKSDDSGSIANQKLMLSEYAKKMGWDIFQIYSDDDYAGSDRNRPAFNRMITDARAKRFDIVLCKTQSRFTRELEIVETYIHNLFPRLGIRFVSIVDNIDTDMAGNKKSRQINGLINEWYLEDMSDSIKAALRTRMKAGYFIGSFAPYGYRKDPDQKGHLLIDEETAPVVQEIFSLYIQGTGRTNIARILNERGIPSPSEYYRICYGKSYGSPKNKSKYWKYFTVSHILENEVYIGNLVQGKTFKPTYKVGHTIPAEKEKWIRMKHTHEPIIDQQTWDLTRKLWNKRSKPCYNGTTNPFSGILVCGKCGYKMSVAYNQHKRYFRCTNAKYGKNCCDGTTIFESTLQKILLSEIQKLKEKYLNPDLTLDDASILADNEDMRKSLMKNLSSLQKNLDDTNRAIKNLYIDKLKGYIEEERFTELLSDLESEKRQYSSQIESLKMKLEHDQSVDDEKAEIIDRVRHLLSFKTITREMVNLFIDSIEIDGNKHNRIANIYWKF